MRKRCSIQLGKKDNCFLEQSPKKLTIPFFGGSPTDDKLMANPEMTVNKKLLIKLKVFNQIS